MELRWFLSMMLLMTLVTIHSVYGHVLEKRESDDYSEIQADGADDDTLNDADGEADDSNDINADILTPPKTYRVFTGSSVTLECEISPRNNTVTQWYKDKVIYYLGHIKVQGEDRLSLNEKTGSLTISNVKESDSGEYVCELAQKTPKQVKHKVVVVSPPVINELKATNGTNVFEGRPLVLNCDVTAIPPPKILWSRQRSGHMENENLRENEAIFNGNNMTIESAKLEDSGTYYCYVFNDYGNAQSGIDIRVLSKPRVHVHKTIVNSKPGIPTVMQCHAFGDPQPHIKWFKDGNHIKNDDTYTIKINGSSSELTFVPSTDKDFGTYICVAHNTHGKHNKSVELIQEPIVDDFEADGPKFSWTVHSHLTLENVELQLIDMNGDGNRTLYTIPLPQKMDKVYEMGYEVKQLAPGKYEAMLKAQNTKGWSRASGPVVIDIEEKPMSIQRSSVFGGNSAPAASHSAALVSATIMYLLVRML